MGYGRYITVHVWLGKGNRLGMLVDAQASWHKSTAHHMHKGFSQLNEGADDSAII